VTNNGKGLKHIRVAGPFTGASPTVATIVSACASQNITWTTAFEDNNYTISC
jgi:hypothetical protein